MKIYLTQDWADMRGTGTSGDWSAPGAREPCEQPVCKGTSATGADVLRACSIPCAHLLGHSIRPWRTQDVHALAQGLAEPLV